MIPLRVYLKNFLCHREQEFVFDGHAVWLLHGPNGVGKSAVFDAMVYALFAEHRRREGSRNAVADMVRYGAEEGMRVEFDFEYRGHRYRVWRTRTRSGQPRQGVGEFLDGNPTPQPNPRVNNARELEEWVCGTLGLTYDAFVSAVLLRQGAAERLIDADRDARRDLFRGIIDLDPYIRLHEAVTTARAEVGGEVRSQRAILEELREVTEAEIAVATIARDENQTAWERTRTAETAARDRLAHAQRWDGLNAACQSIRLHLDAARERANRAEELQRAVSRLHLLRNAVPALARVVDLRCAADTADARLTRLTTEQTTGTDCQTTLTAAGEQERQKATTQRNRVAELDRDIAATTAECTRLRTEIQMADQTADLHRQLETERAKRFDADLDERSERAEAAVEESQAARDAYPHLESVLRQRTAHLRAIAEARTAAEAEAGATTELTGLQVAEGEASRRAEAEEERAETAGQSSAVADAQLDQARGRLTRFCTVAGEAVCSVCLQPIGPGHVERERSELDRAILAAEATAERCKVESRTATEAATAARRAARERETERRRAEATRDEAIRSHRDAESRANAAQLAFENARAELCPELAERIGETAAGTFPTETDVSAAREISRHVQARARARDAIRTACHERDATTASIATLEQAVRAIGAPADVTAARAELDRGQRCLSEYNRERTAAEQRRMDAEQAERVLGERVRAAAAEVNRLAGILGGAQAEAISARQTYDEAVRALPDGAMTWDAVTVAAEWRTLGNRPRIQDHFGLEFRTTCRGER